MAELELSDPKPCPSAESWDTYGLEWLFDPDRTDHLPIDEQLKLYKERDLTRTKVYKYARRIWGGPTSRKRVINASSVVRPQQERTITSTAKATSNTTKDKYGMDAELVEAQQKNNQILGDYRSWVDERKKFRGQLDSMGLNEDWLHRKPHKTALEQRVLVRMIQERTYKPPTPPAIEDEAAQPVLPVLSPTIRRPSPLALKIIERFLHKRKLRLIDLFKSVDKNKNWLLSKDEFRMAIRKAGIPLSDALLEDLILTLDMDLDNKLDYRELATGLGLWKMEKRECKQQAVASAEVTKSPEKLSEVLGFVPPEEEEFEAITRQSTMSPQDKTVQGNSGIQQTVRDRVKSASSSSSGKSLEVPPPDLRPETMVLPSYEQAIDQRVRDRMTLRRLSAKKQGKKTVKTRMTVVKTGDVEADRHLMPSTMTGDAAPLVDKFRQLKYSEYNDVCNICQVNRDVRLSDNLLKKVLLYPEDKTHNQLRRNIRQPAMPLLSRSVVSGDSAEPNPTYMGSPVPSAKIKLGRKQGMTLKT